MATYCVTGGCGFIGSHLAEHLIAAGHQVRVLDDLSSGHRHNLPKGATLTVGDIRDATVVRRWLEDADGCFHLAAIASVERCTQDWAGSHTVNLTGTIVLLDALRGRAVPFVYASSAAVYGDCRALPIGETAARAPLSAYGADKLGCEQQAAVAAACFGIASTGLRFFNVYGPRQDPRSPYSGVISIFCDRMRHRAPVTIYGDGAQTRDFVCVTDVVAALMAAMARTDRGARVFNVCTGLPVSVLRLAQTIGAVIGVMPEIRHDAPRAGEIRHSVGAPDAGRAALGLASPIRLEDGLRQVMTWMGADHG